MIDLAQAILSIRPNSEFTYQNDDYSTIEWHVLEGTAPTKAQVTAAIAALESAESQAEADKAAAKTAVLARLGLTENEAKLLLS